MVAVTKEQLENAIQQAQQEGNPQKLALARKYYSDFLVDDKGNFADIPNENLAHIPDNASDLYRYMADRVSDNAIKSIGHDWIIRQLERKKIHEQSPVLTGIESAGRAGTELDRGLLQQRQQSPLLSGIEDAISPIPRLERGLVQFLPDSWKEQLTRPPSRQEQVEQQAAQQEAPTATAVGRAAGDIGLAASELPIAPEAIAETDLGRAGLFGTQSALQSRGRGEGAAQQAISFGLGAANSLFFDKLIHPALSKGWGGLIEKVTGRLPEGAVTDHAGNPTARTRQILEDAGYNVDQLNEKTKAALRAAPPHANPEQLVNQTLFTEAGVRPTRSAITQRAADFAAEQRRLGDPRDIFEPLREATTEQSQAIQGKMHDLIRNINADTPTHLSLDEQKGVLGQAIKGSLSDRLTFLRSMTKNAYDALGNELDKPVYKTNLVRQDIDRALPDNFELRDLHIKDPQISKRIFNALREYGVIKSNPIKTADEADFSQLAKGDDDIPAANFVHLRQKLLEIERDDNAKNPIAPIIINPLIRQIDSDLARGLPNIDPTGRLAQLHNSARATSAYRHQQIPNDSLIRQFIDTKSDHLTEKKVGSQVVDKLVSPSTPVEHINDVVKQLKLSKDKKGLQALRMSYALKMLDNGFGASDNVIDGKQVFDAAKFLNSFKGNQAEKMKTIFGGDKQKVLDKMNEIRDIAQKLQVPRLAKRGRTDVDRGKLAQLARKAFNELIGMSVYGTAKELGAGTTGSIASAGAIHFLVDFAGRQLAKQEVKEMLKTTAGADAVKTAVSLNRLYPNLARAMGISYVDHYVNSGLDATIHDGGTQDQDDKDKGQE